VTPLSKVIEGEYAFISGEDMNGSFGILPRHVRFQTVLTPGVLTLRDGSGEELYVAAERGYLEVENGEVLAIVRRGTVSRSWEEMEETLRQTLENLDEEERKARRVFEKMKVNMQRHLAELSKE
jgi:alternate F1F0 ATPase F1 subunit epsilon